MEYEEAMRRYEESMRRHEAQRENESFEMAVAMSDAMKMEGVKRLEKAAKAPPGSEAPEEYDEVCQILAEWTGQSIKEADRQIRDAAGRIDKALKYVDTRPRDVPQSVNGLCRLSDFEVYLLRLSRAGVRLLDDEKEDFDEVTAEETPEPTYE